MNQYTKGIVLLMFGLAMAYAQQPNYPTEASQAELIYTDIENFTVAMNHLKKNRDTIQVLNTYYFDRASVGLKEYISRHGLTPDMLKKAIMKRPEDYQKIEAFLNGLSAFKPKMLSVLNRFEEVVPNAMFAPTYLLVGANRGIAQASRYGQLVTVTRIVENEEKLLSLIVHELAHFQQAKTVGMQHYVSLYSQPNNMLGLCLREGGAEFITNQVLGSLTQESSVAYFNENEAELKQKFLDDLKIHDNSFWLWESIGKKEHPQLLGYVMGYKIWSHYFDEVGDRNAVINEILNMTNASECLEKSNYFKKS
ncbi:DUF2268 domain-containing putative Zn-dependent protease [Aestuariivivens sediminicola]|uniref:DUF2268 domain-containing putative Zn-dependent protease n=1 Tax=Aestuariivivens sediminicola TaxID=2913560 RepID=UPI001F57F459|nr:DUF2268 domain-containing putative Zn-dependent protease [Aestuariivivens sediminicola]